MKIKELKITVRPFERLVRIGDVSHIEIVICVSANGKVYTRRVCSPENDFKSLLSILMEKAEHEISHTITEEGKKKPCSSASGK